MRKTPKSSLTPTIEYNRDTGIGGVVSSVSSKYPVRAHDRSTKEWTLARNIFAHGRFRHSRATKETSKLQKQGGERWSHWAASTDGNHPLVR
jgi:hypothetical protein